MTKSVESLMILFFMFALGESWTTLPSRTSFSPKQYHLAPTTTGVSRSATRLQVSISTPGSGSGSEASNNNDSDEDSPCTWQDIWNYDCAMSTVYSATFIAQDWIKSMPCAVGLADCDTPDNLKLPGPAAGSGVEQVDVMSFLNLKRASPLTTEDK